MNYIDLITQIDKKKLNNINLIQVKESYLYDLAIESMKQELLDPAFLDLNFLSYDLEKIDKETYINAVETLPFMDQRKIILIKNLRLERDKIKNYEGIYQAMIDSFKDFNKQTILILHFDGNTIFQTGKLAKAIKKHGDTYLIDRLNPRQFESFIIKHLAKANQKINVSQAAFIAQRLGYAHRDSKMNLFEVVNELDKFIYRIDSIGTSQQVIEEAITEHFKDNIFALTDALSKRDSREALAVVKRLDQDDDFYLFHMILRQIRNLICVKDVIDKRFTKQTGMKYCGIGSFEYDKNASFSRNFTMADLLYLHELAYEIESQFKIGKFNDMQVLIKRLILAFSRSDRR